MSHVEDRENLVLAGRYRLASPAHVGAAPETWDAEALSGGAFTVFYYPDAALTGSGAQRFLRDAPFLRGVEHPRLVPLLDVGVDTTGAVYGVCARCEGETLAARVEREGALPLETAMRVVCDALAALGALHERALIHRGITSADVLLVNDPDGRTRGRLLLAGALGAIARGAERGSKQASHKAFGSPHHLAPEQCRNQPLTPETDVWAMGVVLYEALSGAVPFDGETPLEVVASLLTDEPRPLDARVPDAVRAVIDEALAKRAADRQPDAEALCLQLAAAQGSLPPQRASRTAVTEPAPAPTKLKSSGITRGVPAEFDADDLDGLIARVKLEHSPDTDFSAVLEGMPEHVADPHAQGATSAHPSAEAPPAMADFDLDFDSPTHAPPHAATPGDALPPPPAPLAALPEYIPELVSLEPTSQAAAQAASRESVTHTSLTPEVVDRMNAPRQPRVRTINPVIAVLGVTAVTAVLGYAGWQLSGVGTPPAELRARDEARAHATLRSDGGDTEADGGGAAPIGDPSEATHPENQTPVDFGEQLMIALPPVPRDATQQLIRHVVSAAQPDAASARGFATCAEQTLYLHPGGLVQTLRSAPIDARCDAMDLALVPDVDGDHGADVVAVTADNSSLVVVGSRSLRVFKRIPLEGAVAVVAGLSRVEHRRAEPVVVAYVTPRGGSAALVAIGVRSGSVYWRTPTAFTPAFARDYGLSIGPDADGDGDPDLVTGVLREGTRCVMLLSGADGSTRWAAPRCFDGASAQTLSLGPDVNDDHRGDVALGNSVEGRVRLLSGINGSDLRLIEPDAPGEGMLFGHGAILIPDVARDGFADVAVGRTQNSAAWVEVFSGNDAHRIGKRDLGVRESPATADVRVQYLEGFSFEGSRSVLVASPTGISVIAAAPRP